MKIEKIICNSFLFFSLKINKRHCFVFYSQIILYFIFSTLSCTQKKDRALDKKDYSDEIKTCDINNIDTLRYKRVNDEFYKTDSGEIYELTLWRYDEDNVWYTVSGLNSLMFWGEYPNQKPLKYIIDLDTYKKDTIPPFSRDKNHVYYVRYQADGTYRFIVEHADPKTFVSIGYRWGIDKHHVFTEIDLVPKADPKTFLQLGYDWGKDKKHVFWGTDIVPNADPKTFQVDKESDYLAKDKNHSYRDGQIQK
jgi:hypothetical protein